MRMQKKIWGTAALAGSALAVLAGTVSPAHAAATTASTSTALPLPPVTVLTDKPGDKGGDIFISPFGDSATYQNGAEILSPDGKKVLWSHAAPAGKRTRTSAPRHTTAGRS